MHPSNKAALLGLFNKHDNLSVAVIPTAWDTYPSERKATEIEQQLVVFKQWGFSTSLLELTTVNGPDLKQRLTGKDLVWVMGGNSFYLNYFIHKSGFSGIVKDFLGNGMVYGGESAGAVVAGATLHGVEKVDDPKESPEVVWEGMGLVSSGVLPHWGWEKYRELIQSAKSEMVKFSPVITINNDDAIIFIDDTYEIIKNSSTENAA